MRPVPEAGPGVFVTSTFLRNYLLVRQADVHRAAAAWKAAGHLVLRPA